MSRKPPELQLMEICQGMFREASSMHTVYVYVRMNACMAGWMHAGIQCK